MRLVKNIMTLSVFALLGQLAMAMPASAQATITTDGQSCVMAQGQCITRNAVVAEKRPCMKETTDTRATLGFKVAEGLMHRDMNIPYTQNADIDFLRHMIPHHQGAIDMAEVLLKHGKDKATRSMARAIIKTQKQEIAQMEAMIKRLEKEHGIKAPAALPSPHKGH